MRLRTWLSWSTAGGTLARCAQAPDSRNVVVQAYNPSTQEVETGRSRVQGPQLEANMG